MKIRGQRLGIALIAALSLLALLGLLIAGAVASTAMAQRSVRLTMTDGYTNTSADFALAAVLGDPEAYALADAPIGHARSFSVAAPNGGGVTSLVSVTRLANGVVWLVADAAMSGVDQGHRRVGLVARFPSIGALPSAGIVARGSVSPGATQFVADSTGDADCRRSASVLVLQTSDSSVLYQRGWQTAVLDSAAHLLRVRGDTTIAGGSFSGVLVVDGSLTITGPWIATGLIVVRGSMRATADIEFVGALIVSAGETSVDLAGGSVRYAPCVVAREIRRAFPPRAVAGRAWAELF